MSKARQSARNSLRAYMAAFGQTLPVAPWETSPLSGKPLEQAARKVTNNLDGQAPIPMEAYRPAQANPRPWMSTGSRPIRSKHAKGR